MGQTDNSERCKEILVVDDDHALVHVIIGCLKHYGFGTVGVSNPKDAISLISDNPDLFDLVLTDYEMPEINGIQLANHINLLRIRAGKPKMPMILVTGSSELDHATVFKAGFSGFLGKPFKMQDLADAVNVVLQGIGENDC